MAENQITERIKKLLKENNITISELASKLNVSAYGLQKMFKANSYKVDTLQKIADALNVEITEFVGDTLKISEYNELKRNNEVLDVLLRSEKNYNEKLYLRIHELIHFVLSNTYYNELIENYVKATEYGSIQTNIAKRISSSKHYQRGYYIPFDHDTVSRIINSVLFEYPAIATAYEKKKIKNELLIKQYQEWKNNPPSYPEKD